MDFEDFERLERYNLLSNKIEEIKHRSSTGGNNSQSSKPKGLNIKNTGEYTRT